MNARPALLALVCGVLGCRHEQETPLPAVSQRSAEPGPVPAVAMVEVPAGTWTPLFPSKEEREVKVEALRLDATPVTNARYLAFVRERPEWRKSRVKRLFADARYLEAWAGDLDLGRHDPAAPVTNVSWFAARAYAKWSKKRLPTLAEWEWAARGGRDDAQQAQEILRWYARPTPALLPAVGTSPANAYGLHDLHGLVWEWVLDFDSAMTSGESRGDSALERGLYCGSGALGSANPKDYAAFMRYAFRSALRADYCVQNLGFRCAEDLQ